MAIGNKTTVDQYGLTDLSEENLNLLQQIIEESDLKLDDAILLEDDDASKNKEDTSIRSCKTGFLPVRDELVQMFGRLIQDYNQNFSNWNYDLEFIEAIQLGHYHKGDHYDWHIDSFANPSTQTNHEYHPNRPYNRKVSGTVFLNDPEEYEGGEFDLETRGPNWDGDRFESFKMPKGTMILFPSHYWHRVRPVTSGVRKSLVLWVQGPPFK